MRVWQGFGGERGERYLLRIMQGVTLDDTQVPPELSSLPTVDQLMERRRAKMEATKKKKSLSRGEVDDDEIDDDDGF